jgi:hypothetical protein
MPWAKARAALHGCVIDTLQATASLVERRNRERAMSMVMIRCPKTGAEVPTGLETDASSFASLPEVETEVSCRSCGAVHTWTRRDAWLAAKLSLVRARDGSHSKRA